ncbi:magnesium transporter [Candidatus Pseudothioglobus singularis]|jgi:magnesium transporter|uniref:magnesium transporter n=1 Tax=Candidatus Pseudothioglobus singularis TaxID=1427364 RepID=UPI00036C4637|nr:magnesium transporter [Candidatus Pseudothioglobus singularis]MDG1166655.1 magnesium transporter [Candidatus Thioglobus sp.]ANQ66414.1 magnesium transporter [Candidatus Pseudothioglobus singularis]MDA7441347.1 magnesium transporter [Candidatus Pseudothioglobus singularis]MDC0596503.1 magnesium transporter [Candidatus Pseudothioglobus singularis]MDC0964375.1 magnesium transporter [Candidatus Pseudothioglobus singularis]|tara:strand:+ start:323 stop:1678 length:1356 start_codon:yes stop_codon:yes gene_type:complete
MAEIELTSFEVSLQNLMIALEASDYDEAKQQIKDLHPGEIALLLEAIQPKDRSVLWPSIEISIQGEILKEVSEDVQSQLISEMTVDSLVKATEKLDTDDLADIVPNMPESAVHSLLLTLDFKHRERLNKILSYPEDSAGGLMNTDFITVRPDVSIRAVIRYLRLLKEMPIDTDQVFVVDRNFNYLGSLLITSLLTEEPERMVETLINNDFSKPVSADTDETEVALLFEQRNLISAPVIDENNQLVGRITIDDVVDVIRDQAEHSVMSMVGLDEDEDVFAPIIQSSKRRSVWLGVNLVTAFIAVYFIGLFEATLQQKIALAILMPVVASMGGIAGTQTLIIVTRGIATGRVTTANIKTLINKEVAVSGLNGIIWSIVIGLITYYWFADLLLSLIIALAIITNLVVAAFSGAFLPLLLSKLKIDPALAGGVILTTITDVIGFVAFLGLAALFI